MARLQWRADQIRELDNDYQHYRQERYQKFCEEFGAWRKNRKATAAQSGSQSGARTAQASNTSDPSAAAQDSPGGARDNK